MHVGEQKNVRRSSRRRRIDKEKWMKIDRMIQAMDHLL
jgi:hypothetical protein